MADKVSVIAWLRKYAGAYTIPGVDNNELANWLAATPAPLTNEQAHILAFKLIVDHPQWHALNNTPVGKELHPFAVAFARAVEAAHGIGKEASNG